MSDHQETLTDGQEVTSTDCSEETEKHSSLPVAPTEDSEEVVDTSQKDQVVPSPSKNQIDVYNYKHTLQQHQDEGD